MKLINATFEAFNDLAEFNLRNTLNSLGAKYVKTIPNTDHLKEDATFKKLKKLKKDAETNMYDFINKNRL